MATIKVKRIHGSGYEEYNNGYALYEDKDGYQYSAWLGRGTTPDPREWATLNRDWERSTPLFTREYCDYQGIDRDEYTQIIVID